MTGEGVIDWEGAMEQCGDDEEFLRELLSDLRGEIETQIQKIDETLRAPTQGHLHQIMRAAHVIKGAASNLMCQQLRTSAMNLEQAAAAANDLSGDASAMANVQGRYMELSQAVESYKKFLISVGV